MPLQLRRGTDAQRSGVVFAAGELIYVTDTDALYVGDGATAGGVAVANLGAADIRNISAGVFTGGSHSGITFTYDGTNIDAVVDPDLSNYQGVIRASSFNGSLVADDSSLLVDALIGKINLDGTVKGNIIPDANSVYDIGSSGARFRDLYLSGSTLYLGTAQVTAVGSAVNLPAGSTVNGVPIGSGSGTGDGVIEGSTYKINIAGDDSTLIVNATTEVVTAQGGFIGNLTGTAKGNVVASDDAVIVNYNAKTVTAAGGFFGTLTGNVSGNVSGNLLGNVTGNVSGDLTGNVIATDTTTMVNPLLKTVTATGGFFGNVSGALNGNVTGDLKGSVFNDDSSMIVDATSGTLIGTYKSNTQTLTIRDHRFINSGGSGTDPIFLNDVNEGYIKLHPSVGGLEVRGFYDSLNPTSNNAIQNYASRGTFSVPTAVTPGDSLSNHINFGYDGSSFVFGNSVSTVVDPRYSVSVGSVKALYTIAFPDRSVANDTIFYADTNGVFVSPVAFQATPLSNPTARDTALPSGKVAAGMIVFLTDSTGSGGAPKLQVNTDGTTSGWVNLH